nr:unnamed protein product [Callosobruchus analis]
MKNQKIYSKGARLMAKFIRQLNKTLEIDLNNVELIGHGGGAHIAGIIGNKIKPKIKSIRLTHHIRYTTSKIRNMY